MISKLSVALALAFALAFAHAEERHAAHWGYAGSLTTPPCSEGVAWHVLRDPVELSKGQVAAFRKLYPMNACPVQPLNGRTVQASN